MASPVFDGRARIVLAVLRHSAGFNRPTAELRPSDLQNITGQTKRDFFINLRSLVEGGILERVGPREFRLLEDPPSWRKVLGRQTRAGDPRITAQAGSDPRITGDPRITKTAIPGSPPGDPRITKKVIPGSPPYKERKKQRHFQKKERNARDGAPEGETEFTSMAVEM